MALYNEELCDALAAEAQFRRPINGELLIFPQVSEIFQQISAFRLFQLLNFRKVEKRARSFGATECLIFLDGLSRLHEGMDEDGMFSVTSPDGEP